MKFEIENGKNICSIGLSEIGSYIRFNYPITVVWNDCQGSVGKYFCTLPYNEEYRKTVEKTIADNLKNDFSENINDLYEILKPLLPIFKNGTYFLNFHSNKEKEFFKYKNHHFKEPQFKSLEIIFTDKTTDISNLVKVIEEHKLFIKENANSQEYYPSKILEYTTSGIYPGDDSFYATQPFDKIDKNRVKYFEEIIKKGERPFAILFRAVFYSKYYNHNSSNYILDGHHKLLAYKNLGLYPPLALLTYCPKEMNELEFDTEILSKVLYPFQLEHILKNWRKSDNVEINEVFNIGQNINEEEKLETQLITENISSHNFNKEKIVLLNIGYDLGYRDSIIEKYIITSNSKTLISEFTSGIKQRLKNFSFSFEKWIFIPETFHYYLYDLESKEKFNQTVWFRENKQNHQDSNIGNYFESNKHITINRKSVVIFDLNKKKKQVIKPKLIDGDINWVKLLDKNTIQFILKNETIDYNIEN